MNARHEGEVEQTLLDIEDGAHQDSGARHQGVNPFFLEQLYQDMGQPRWFWPAVLVVIFLLWGLAGATEF